MTFKIKDYVEIISEISTEWTAICPNCKMPKLKIKKNNGAYLCVNTPFCTTDQIRTKLGKKKRNEEKYVPYLEPLSLINLKHDFKIGKITEEIEMPIKHKEKTVYSYNNFFKVDRIDIFKKKKSFYPYYKINDKWIKSSDVSSDINKTDLSCFYRSYLLLPHELMLVVEGEKCTDFVIQNLKLKCVTPPGLGWSYEWLKINLQKLNPAGIIIIPDHDKAGIDKAYLLQRVAWELKIPCSVIFIYEILTQEKDIADLNDKDLKIVREKLEKWI